jgi:hypothetical protein
VRQFASDANSEVSEHNRFNDASAALENMRALHEALQLIAIAAREWRTIERFQSHVHEFPCTGKTLGLCRALTRRQFQKVRQPMVRLALPHCTVCYARYCPAL